MTALHQWHRLNQTPLRRREKGSEKLKQLDVLGVIEKVSGQTSWMNPFVVLEKPNSDIRICLDMRQANLAILWEVHTRDIRGKSFQQT